jgi:hypothetical protein
MAPVGNIHLHLLYPSEQLNKNTVSPAFGEVLDIVKQAFLDIVFLQEANPTIVRIDKTVNSLNIIFVYFALKVIEKSKILKSFYRIKCWRCVSVFGFISKV